MAPIQNLHAHTEGVDTFTPGETMRALNISRSTLDRYVSTGRLHPVRLPSGVRRFPRAEIAAVIAGEPWEPAS